MDALISFAVFAGIFAIIVTLSVCAERRRGLNERRGAKGDTSFVAIADSGAGAGGCGDGGAGAGCGDGGGGGG